MLSSALSDGNANVGEHLTGMVWVALPVAAITVPVSGLIGSGLPRWRRVF